MIDKKILYVLLAFCLAALIYMKKSWENIDFQNLTLEGAVILALIAVLIIIGVIFVSPYLHIKLPFQEGWLNKKKIYGGKDITKRR
jgi:hypothetical protein